MVWDDITIGKLSEVGFLVVGILGCLLYLKYAEYQTKKKGKK